ncbi:hypothetical protein BX070DRAFT_230548 [Coemansia spiralis]|nr:hypothetical protein BX070DRAFT_230548 [Coemansia spiralis]
MDGIFNSLTVVFLFVLYAERFPECLKWQHYCSYTTEAIKRIARIKNGMKELSAKIPLALWDVDNGHEAKKRARFFHSYCMKKLFI